MSKSKIININFVRAETLIQSGRTIGNAFFLAFDFEPASRKAMMGIGISDPDVADSLSKSFASMAKALRDASTKINLTPACRESHQPGESPNTSPA